MDIETFRILTFNIWGLRYLSEKRNERISAFTTLLLTSPHHVYDVICLQEVWVESDFLLLKAALHHEYPHSAYWPSSVIGSGLAAFSKWEIVERDFLAFSFCGAPGEIGGDWPAGKGVGSMTLNVGNLGEVEILNTHFFAKGGEDGPETKRAVRISNAWEMSKLVRKAITSGRHVIAAGDFNSSPHSLPMKVMLSHGNLVDTWAASHPPPPASPPNKLDSSGRQTAAEREAQETLGLTVDTPSNSWSAGKKLDDYARRWLGKRLDYILYHSHLQSHSQNTRGCVLSVQNTAVVLAERVPGHDFSYSDHFGLEATFSVVPILKPPLSDWPKGMGPVLSLLPPEDLLTAVDALFQSLLDSYSRTRRHKAYLLFGFFAPVLAVLIPTRVSPGSIPWEWNSILIAVITAMAAIGGTMSLYFGIIYGIRERSRLTNIIEEMECARRGQQVEQQLG